MENQTMSKKQTLKPIAAVMGTAFAASMAVSNVASAADTGANPFAMNELSSGYMQVAAEGKCGGAKPSSEGKCGSNKAPKGMEGKCGEGKCGNNKEMQKNMEGNCGGKKAEKEGKCGEGKCGANKK
jgi:uncharacterized low-complexity protein